jgi:hypothetical protein
MPRALLRAVALFRLHVNDDSNVTEAAAADALDSRSNSASDSNPLLGLFRWAVMELHELIEDSHGEVSTLKVTILAVAAIHVIALARARDTRMPQRSSPPSSTGSASPKSQLYFWVWAFFCCCRCRARGRRKTLPRSHAWADDARQPTPRERCRVCGCG